MESKVATYAIISLPGNNFRVYTDNNLLTNNPSEVYPSDYIALRGTTDFKYPGIRSSMQLTADNYKSVKKENLFTNNPRETTTDRQLFSKVIYGEAYFSEGLNAFRDSYGAGSTLRPIAQVAGKVEDESSRKEGIPKILQVGSLFVPL